jgi:hypothetical protein
MRTISYVDFMRLGPLDGPTQAACNISARDEAGDRDPGEPERQNDVK